MNPDLDTYYCNVGTYSSRVLIYESIYNTLPYTLI